MEYFQPGPLRPCLLQGAAGGRAAGPAAHKGGQVPQQGDIGHAGRAERDRGGREHEDGAPVQQR
jgi:hypothetical protein